MKLCSRCPGAAGGRKMDHFHPKSQGSEVLTHHQDGFEFSKCISFLPTGSGRGELPCDGRGSLSPGWKKDPCLGLLSAPWKKALGHWL